MLLKHFKAGASGQVRRFRCGLQATKAPVSPLGAMQCCSVKEPHLLRECILSSIGEHVGGGEVREEIMGRCAGGDIMYGARWAY